MPTIRERWRAYENEQLLLRAQELGLGGGGISEIPDTQATDTEVDAKIAAAIAALPAPSPAEGGPVTLTGWVTAPQLGGVEATSNRDNLSLAHMLDGIIDESTWSSAAAQSSGDHVTVDFGRAIPLTGLRQVCTRGANTATDYPRSYEVLGSATGAFAGEQVTLRASRALSAAGVIEDTWAVTSVRYLRIRLTSGVTNHWRINQLVFQVLDAPVPTVIGGPAGPQGEPGADGAAGVNTAVTKRTWTFSQAGALTVKTGTHRIYNDTGSTITIGTARLAVGTAPTGAGVQVLVKQNGTTAITRTISAGAQTESGTGLNVAWTAGQYLTVDIASIGSTVAGSDLTVTLTEA